jgi:hypothetical protein
MLKNTKSRSELARNIEQRAKHVMVSLLNKFEQEFPEIKDSRKGGVFRYDIKNKINDFVRATRDELNDYDIAYRPLKVNPDNSLSVTVNFMETIKLIKFWAEPGVTIHADKSKYQLLDAVRAELGTGAVFIEGDKAVLEIYGLNDCIKYVIPFLDHYKLNADVNVKYLSWRSKVIGNYRGARDDRK